ncbi:MAG: DUF2332 domain-containing protein [Pseudomonadota bacterium]
MAPALDDIIDAFHRQARFCEQRGASFTGAVCAAAGNDIQDGGPVKDIVEGFEDNPWRGAIALRIAGALHYLALKDRAGGLQSFYERVPTVPALAVLQPLISELACEERAVFLDYVSRPPQTNEINRSAALLPGLHFIAQWTQRPIDLFELGCSAGLLLGLDRFRVEYSDANDGAAFALGPVGAGCIKSEWRGARSELTLLPEIKNRFGCDQSPVDLTDKEQLVRMHSYIWPEQPQRRKMFDAAFKERLLLNVDIEKADALRWTQEMLKSRHSDRASVFFHSVFAVYLNDQQQRELDALFSAAGASATTAAPLARLSFEPVENDETLEFFVEAQFWPGGEKRRLYRAHPHGAWVEPLTNVKSI